MIWRRVLVPDSTSVHELHGIFQVTMGGEGVHLFLAACEGSWNPASGSGSPAPVARIFAHAAQPLAQGLESVRFSGLIQIPERHSKLFQFPLDCPDGKRTGVPSGDGLSPASLEPALERAFLCHGLVSV